MMGHLLTLFNTTGVGAGGALPAPSNLVLSVTGAAFDVLTGTYDPVSGATTYEYEYSPDGVTYVDLGTTGLLTFNITSVVYDVDAVTHYIRVRAVGGDDWTVAEISGLLIGLVAYWNLNESSGNRADSAGINTLIPSSTTSSTTGVISNAAVVDGITSGAMETNTASFSTGVPFTCIFWIKPTTDGPVFGIFSFLFAELVGVATNLVLYYNGGAANLQNGNITNGSWNHIELSYDGTTLTSTVNNALTVNAMPSLDANSGLNFRLGGRAGSGASAIADYDEVGYWNRKLSSMQFAVSYNSGNGFDPTA